MQSLHITRKLQLSYIRVDDLERSNFLAREFCFLQLNVRVDCFEWQDLGIQYNYPTDIKAEAVFFSIVVLLPSFPGLVKVFACFTH